MEPLKPLTGSIRDIDRKYYLTRKCDFEVAKLIGMGNYISIIEPRQQGKTSLIHGLTLNNAVLIYIDVATFKRYSAEAWYQSLNERLTELLEMQIPDYPRPKPWALPGDWRNYLVEIAIAAQQRKQLLVIAFDEIGAAQFKGSNEFFAVLREVYNARGLETEKYFNHLTFLFAGTFSINDLITNPFSSPFNVAVRVRLEDFTQDELIQLAGVYGWVEPEAAELAEVVHHWTNGQPYLSQAMFYKLSGAQGRRNIKESGLGFAAEEEAEELLSSDGNNIRSLRDRLERLFALNDVNYRAKLEGVLTGSSTKYFPATVSWQEQFELAGIIKRGEDKRCQIRCHLYEKFLKSWLEIQEKDRSAEIMDAKQRIFQRRLKDLEAHIDDLYQMLNEFEKHLFYNDDPRTSQKDRNEIEKIKEMIIDYLRELEKIETDLGKSADVLADQTGTVEIKLTQLSQHLDRIEVLVQPLTQALATNRISNKDQEEILDLVRAIHDQLPTPESEKVKEILSAPEGGVSHKLKLSLPILYPFLSYEGEIGIEGRADLEALVSQIKDKLRQLSKRKKLLS